MNGNNLVLLAENQAIDAAYMRLLLERNGWKTEVVSDGDEVMEKLRKNSYSFVVINDKLSKIDAFELARRIREQEKNSNRHLIIIGLTSYAMESEHRRFLKAGIDYCLSKPVYSSSLVAALGAIFNGNTPMPSA